jgi:hypothetical protein
MVNFYDHQEFAPLMDKLHLWFSVDSQTSNPNVRTILMSAYNFEEDILFLKYMEEGIIDSTIDKPVTMN